METLPQFTALSVHFSLTINRVANKLNAAIPVIQFKYLHYSLKTTISVDVLKKFKIKINF